MNPFPLSVQSEGCSTHTRRYAGVGDFCYLGETGQAIDQPPRSRSESSSLINRAAVITKNLLGFSEPQITLSMSAGFVSERLEKDLCLADLLRCYVEYQNCFTIYEIERQNSGFLRAWKSIELLEARQAFLSLDEFHKIHIKPDRRSRAPELPSIRKDFSPSDELCRFVLLAEEKVPKEGKISNLTESEVRDRRDHIVNAACGLFQAIADSIQRQGKTRFQVGEEGRFEDAVAKALLFRIRVGVYGQAAFLENLFSEFSSSSVSGRGWRLSIEDPDALVLVTLETRENRMPMRSPRARAIPIRLKMTQFPES